MKGAHPPVRKTSPRREQQDLLTPELYLNRELSWLEFNRRVLHQVRDERVPLLERIKFAAIVSSNLDEFFMKRIGGLKQQIGARLQSLTMDGRSPKQQIVECYGRVREIEGQKEELLPELTRLLAAQGIALVSYQELSARERKLVREHFFRNIYPLVTPQAMDPAHPFPFVSNLSLNLLVTLRAPQAAEISLARVKVPVGAGAPRFLQVGEKERYIPLEEVMCNNLDMLFPEMEVLGCELFRVTRNANTERNEEHADDLLAMIETELQHRKFAPIVRLEVKNGMDPVHRGMLAAELALDESADVFEVGGMLAMRDLLELAGLDRPELRYPPHIPLDHPRLQTERNIFHIVRDAGSILLHHPYESFSSSVERFLQEAGNDPKVRAIKMTLYRTSSQSRIIDHLIAAARGGKQVAVVVELKARFDEAANIRLASRMEEVGIHVTYGVVGLKTHCKVILVVRQDFSGLRRYVHIGTGNYHPGTARLYCDYGLLTSDPLIGEDATELFNYLTTGYTPKRPYHKLLPAPKLLKKALLSRIERETALHSKESPGLLRFKMNALDDVEIIRALYRAARAGVLIDLIVRDSCRLRPGVKGVSETIRVVSIVGRFLEHTRVYYFRNGGAEEYFIGSADAMRRNLEDRVEVMVPVEDPALQRELEQMFEIQLGDPVSAWEMQADGSYRQRQPESDQQAAGSHQRLIEFTQKKQKDSLRFRRKKARAGKKRNLL
ncbi:polyphosphate kinase 1 [Desulfuromonas carbonis]|uniref:polyphosphate kinase 1 n=1 Tax=Desulfuromonas sp. DDH964 TaxID=1823759 RepID=UPI00078CDAF3|nr:polyphosphate kinase 1 [Desulfuromonas sp. DDH964]AMV73701.1 polyphosphate kinase [Desulfuromonas sp. DDH964]